MSKTPFIQSIMKNDYTTFRNLLGSNKVNAHIYSFDMKEKSILNQHNEKPQLSETNVSLLHIAAYADSLEIFIYLHEDCNLPLDSQNLDGYYPLHYACYGGSLEVVSYILQQEPQQATLLPKVEHHFLYFATFSGNSTILSLLFRCGADINAIQNRRDSPIIVAIKKRYIECLKILLQEGSRLDQSRGYSSIMEALKLFQKDAVPLLLEYGEDPSIFSDDGNCALSLAAFQQYPDIVQLLCNNLGSIEPDTTAPYYHTSAVHWGCQSYMPEIMEMLLEKNINVNQLDRDGFCGPHYLIDVGTPENNIKILEMLYENGFNVNIQNPFQNNTSLLEEFMCTIKSQFEIIQWLIEHGADPLVRAGGNGPRLVTILLQMPNLPASLKELLDPFAKEAISLDNQEKFSSFLSKRSK